MKLNRLAWIGLLILTAACGRDQSFQANGQTPNGPTDMGNTSSASFRFPMQATQDQFTQDSVQPNVTTLTFLANDKAGGAIANLQKAQVQPVENGVTVQDFTLSSQQSSTGRVADIVFVLDSTDSMQPYIDDVKVRVRQFVNNLAKSHVKANLCLELFGDEIRQYCRAFVEDDPATVANENIDDFLNELSKVHAHGGDDIPENQMGALEAAATTTPWHANSQRVAILITDANFHYAPDHLGDAPTAPTYQHALDTVVNSHMQVFLMGPNEHGYNSNFKGLPPVPAASGGEWFDFGKIVSGSVDMSQILDMIVDRLTVTYTLTYTADKQAGLNPGLPLSQRNFSIGLMGVTVGSSAQVVGAGSSLPNGHPNLKNAFALSALDADASSMKVSVNGAAVTVGISVNAGTLTFNTAPAPASLISVAYMRKALRNNLKMQPITFNSVVPQPTVTVLLNGTAAAAADFRVLKMSATGWMLELNDSVFIESDPYRIMSAGGVSVDVTTK